MWIDERDATWLGWLYTVTVSTTFWIGFVLVLVKLFGSTARTWPMTLLPWMLTTALLAGPVVWVLWDVVRFAEADDDAERY